MLFAQTIYTCLASSSSGLFYKLISSIGVPTMLLRAKAITLLSSRALRIIQSVNDDVPTLCIVDEF